MNLEHRILKILKYRMKSFKEILRDLHKSKSYKGYLSIKLNNLRKKNLISKMNDQTDRRRKFYQINQAGIFMLDIYNGRNIK